MSAGLALLIVVLVGVFLLVLTIQAYNALIFQRNQAERAWFNIDVLLKQRHDEIPKLIAVCEGSAKFERSTLDQVITARQAAVAAPGVAAKAQAEGALSAAVGRLLAVAEAYPELKTVALFGQLQARVSSLESEIADRREFYNDATTNYNTAIQQFPGSVLAGFGGMRPRELFQVADADKSDVEVKFNL